MSNPVVYLVDDETMCREPIQQLIGALGFKCKAFSSGSELLSDIETNQPTVVIADTDMPHMNGLELFDKLIERGINCPFVLISGHAKMDSVASTSYSELAGFLKKPFGVLELRSLLERLVPAHRETS